MAVSTGVETLDGMLNGGFPEERAVAVAGTPGTGKTTLAMQFLQAGLDDGEQCLFISSEQGIDGLYDSLGHFGFDLDHGNLRLVSLQTGRTSDSGDGPMMSVIDDRGNTVDMQSFTEERVRVELERYGPFERVVVDSVSGLELLVDDEEAFRRGSLDLIRMLTHEFDATTVLTAEYTGAASQEGEVETVSSGDIVQYTVDGVVRVWRERRGGELRRFIDVMKMRGVDHDVRQHEIQFDDDGIRILPRRRALPAEIRSLERLSTGIDGLDALLEGGWPKGEGTLLEHDGAANVNELVFTAGVNAIRQGMTMVLIPRANASPRQIDEFVGSSAPGFGDAGDMLEAGSLEILDPLDTWPDHESVFKPETEDPSLRRSLKAIDEDNPDSGLFLALNTEVKAHTMATDEVRRFRYWASSQFLGEKDVLLDVHNPEIMRPELAEMYSDAASVGVETWVDDTGLQYLRLKKANVGQVGKVRLVAYTEEPPYIRVR